MPTSNAERHRKHLAVMRGWLNGRNYFMAAEALEFAVHLHEGLRKDGVTPKFYHQLSIARFLLTLEPHFLHPEETLATAFLHDTPEDNDEIVTFGDLKDKFGDRVARSTRLVTKKYRGSKIPYDRYFEDMAQDPVASLVKGVDRAHNVQTMLGVFKIEKQQSYLKEVEEWFFPMLKTARRLFPQQAPAYENIKTLLRCQVRLYESLHRGEM
jgi:(p)ppGpp synthase/HD superfamily hydrolase